MVFFRDSSSSSLRAALMVMLMALAVGFIPLAQAQPDAERVEVEAELVQPPSPDSPLIVEVTLKIPESLYVYRAEDHFFDLTLSKGQGLGEPRISLPPTKLVPDLLSNVPGAETPVFEGASVIKITAEAAGDPGNDWALEGEVSYQACSDTLCYPPQTRDFSFAGQTGVHLLKPPAAGSPDTPSQPRDIPDVLPGRLMQFRISGRTVGYKSADDFIKFLDSSLQDNGESQPFTDLSRYSVWLTVLLILLGGLALNLTPCVLPLIPVNLTIIGAGASTDSRLRGLARGAVYGAGIAIAYGILGVIVVVTGATFGTINASPWFNLTVAVLFVLLGLAVIGVFNIDFSNLGGRLDSKFKGLGPYTLAFLMGGVAALLAGACVAPVVIAVLILSAERYAEGQQLALLYPFLLGLGMGLPWPLAGTGLSILPKPGRWMKAVRYVMSVLILALAVYYGWESVKLFRGLGQVPAQEQQQGDAAGLEWHHDLDAALQTALSENKPVLVDFWASWCKNCHVMDRTTFRNPRVQRRLDAFVPVKFRAEKPGAPETKPALDYFGVLGLPTYVVLEPVEPDAVEN